MAFRNTSLRLTVALNCGLLLTVAGSGNQWLAAQTPAPAASASVSQRGTVKAISGSTITMATDAGQSVTVNVATAAKIVKLPVGSTDLTKATPSQLSDVAVGDRILVTGKAGDSPETFAAVRVILMKSSDIASMQAAQEADWRTRGVGGVVSAVDPSTGAITIASGAKKIVVNTSSKTAFKRFAGDSVKYQDAKVGTIADVQPKDQLQARGAKSEDGSSVQAEEVISGSFENLSGQIASIDPAAGKITLKDLATKKMITVNVTGNSNIRLMPAQMASMFAARSNGGAAAGGGRRGGGGGAMAGGPGGAAGGMGGAQRSAGADLSQMMSRFPPATLEDLHKGDAVMIVASEPTPGASTVTAVTLLTGVDPILTANPNGGMDLSMSIGGGGGGAE
jgi:co-chaperonin GroES (HSP10)